MSLEKLLQDGAEAMAANRFEDAVGIYSEACQMSNLENGKDDPDLMFLYGKALFENAVQSSDVLGNVEKKKEREEKRDTDTKDKDEEDVQFQFNDKLAEEEDEEEKEEEEEELPANKIADESDSSDEEVEAPNEEAEQSDFEIAWEILDLTRILYDEEINNTKINIKEPYNDNINEENKEFINKYSRLCDVYMLMGDISLENENFIQSIEDYEKGNKMLLKLFNLNNGRLHEAKFKLSLSYEFLGDEVGLNKSIECMKELLDMIENREEDKGLVEEVKSRLYDLQVLQRERNKEKAQLVGLLKGVSSGSGSGSVDAVVARDLSGLVKKRKKNSSGRVSK